MAKIASFALICALLPFASATCSSDSDFSGPCIPPQVVGSSCDTTGGVCAASSTGDVQCCPASALVATTSLSSRTSSSSSTSCYDRLNPRTGTSDCPARVSLCTNSAYKTLMAAQCPKTCGLCSSSSSCVDKTNAATGISDCPARAAAGYCTRKYYTTLMRKQCPSSCGFC
ncbi:unnamed protein product, partial [Mesorhabditis belari]|uniref:ShKT domain-containing protein n=1 Tax=Mesorhabditis belari TaxID=2138241 RepID=A0AAF3JAY4_9BILA